MGVSDNELHRIVPTAIVYRDGKFLILKRSEDKKVYPGRWTVPGGGVEVTDYADTPKTSEDGWYYQVEKSLRREIREETGLEASRLHYLLDMVFIRPDKVPVLVLSYYGEAAPGEVTLDGDSSDFAWVTHEEAKEYDLLPGLLEEIEMVDRILAGADPSTVKFPVPERV